jgi:hypothetical protein
MSIKTVPPAGGGSASDAGGSGGPAQIPAAPMLALAGHRRRPVVLVWGLLLVLIGGLAGWWGVQSTGSRTAVVVMAADVNYGDVISLRDLAEADVMPDPGLLTIPWSAASSLVGKIAATDLLRGTLVSSRAVTGGRITTAGQSIVGVTVTPSQAPTMPLQPRDTVLLVLIPAASEADSVDLTTQLGGVSATVLSVGAVQSGSRTVDVIVRDDAAAAVAVLAASDRLAIVFVSRG